MDEKARAPRRLVSESRIPLDPENRPGKNDPMDLVAIESFLSTVLSVRTTSPLLHMAAAQLQESCKKHQCKPTDLFVVCRIYKLEEGTLEMELNYTPNNSKG